MNEKKSFELKDLEVSHLIDSKDDVLESESEFDFLNAIVPTTDDPSIPDMTFRVFLLGTFYESYGYLLNIGLGTLWNVFLGSVNAILALRTNSFSIDGSVATLMCYPMGIFLHKIMPKRNINFFGLFQFNLNPGPYSIKEHVLTYIIASAAGGVAYGVDNVIVQKYAHFMGNSHINFWNSIGFVMSVQLLGFGMAGILRRFLIKPQAMYWPSVLPTVAMFVGFHEHKTIDQLSKARYKLSRLHFFLIACAGIFVYQWIPEKIMSSLTFISIFCLLFSNKIAKLISSSSAGVGLGSLTLNWQLIGGGSISNPFSTTIQSTIGAIIWCWIIIPILYANNVFGMDQSLDGGVLNTSNLHNSTGSAIEPVDLMNTDTYELNTDAYNQNQPIYITTMFAIQYGQDFMGSVAAIVHVFLWYGSSILKQLKAAMRQEDNDDKDIHNRLMKAYPDVQEWMYLAFLGVMIIVQIAVSLWTPFAMPVWSVFLCILMVLFFLLPIGVITAITGFPIYINVISEFLIGLMIPGQTIAVMAFKSLGTNSLGQALTLLSDLKIGHYLKINPVYMVVAQLYGAILGAIVNTAVSIDAEEWLKTILFIDDNWKVNDMKVFYDAGAIWGAIGPQRFFGIGSVYEKLLWFFLAGAVLPFIPWALNRIYPSKWWIYINIPILSKASIAQTGAPQSGLISTFVVGYIFQYYIFNRHREWWNEYNYVLATALDTGAGIQSLFESVLESFVQVNFPVWALNPSTGPDYYCFGNSWIETTE